MEPHDPSDELVDHVDSRDEVIEVVTRRRMRADRLRHRAVFIAIRHTDGRLLVHRRSMEKDIWPGWCDIAVGGVVSSGESYDQAARRELAEEIGIDVVPMAIDGGISRAYDDDSVSLFGRCYTVVHEGPFRFADGEVSEAWWSTGAELRAMRGDSDFLPDSLALLWPLLDLDGWGDSHPVA